jgi:hypothetical protein
MLPKEPPKAQGDHRRAISEPFDLESWIARYNIQVHHTAPWNGGTKRVLATCPWNPDHTDKAAYIVQFASGAIATGCHHNSCQGRGWHDLRDAVEPGWRDWREHRPGEADGRAESGQNGKQPTVAIRLLALAQRSGARFFCDSESGDYYVAPRGNGALVSRLDGQETARWLARLWLEAEASPVAPDAIKAALFTLSALVDESDAIPLAVRVAWWDGVLWYDLGGLAVQADATGWKLVEEPPIIFKRFPHQLPQVRPSPPGDFSRLDRYLPVSPGSEEALLLKVWLLVCMSPDGPRPVLDIAGPQGSGKSSLERVLKRILDPSRVPTIRRLVDLRDLQQQLAQTWALFADNLSGIGPETSDMLAAAITGDATFRRRLYTNDDAQLFSYRRVLCLSGISHTAERPDLLDRTILVTLQRIPKERRLDEATYWQKFEADLPQILGGSFAILAKAIALLPGTTVESIPQLRSFRMTDFARWGYAIAEAAGWGGPRFLAAYERNINRQHKEAVSASLLAQAILEFMADRDEWEGPASLLKNQLDLIAQDSLGIDPTNRRSGWPQDAARLSKEVFRLAETLADSGVLVSRPARTGKRGRAILLQTISDPSITTDTSDTSDTKSGDAKGDSDPGDDTADASSVTSSQIQSDGSDAGDGKVGTRGGATPKSTRRLSL